MHALRLALLVPFAAMLISASAAAAGLEELNNYLEYSPRLSSSGQPTAAELETLRDAGFERIVYIAFTDHDNALPNEDRLAKSLGLQYLHVPVDWEAPAAGDFYLVAGALQEAPDKRTLLHCQVNYRASAFALLYRVIYEDVPVAQARADMERIWQPNETWQRYIDTLLEENGVDADGQDQTGGDR